MTIDNNLVYVVVGFICCFAFLGAVTSIGIVGILFFRSKRKKQQPSQNLPTPTSETPNTSRDVAIYPPETLAPISDSRQNSTQAGFIETFHADNEIVQTEGFEHFNEEAIDLFLQAVEILEKYGDDVNDQQSRNIISLLSLAIKKAGKPFPRAHALLSLIYYMAGDKSSAKQQANAALSTNPDEFRAQLTKVFLSLDGIRVLEVNGWLLPRGIGAFYIFEFIWKLFVGLFHGTSTTTTQLLFKNEVNKLTHIYQRLCNTEILAAEYYYFSDRLLFLADIIDQNRVPMPGGRPNLYAVITSASLNNLVFDEDDNKIELQNEIRQLRQLAQGRAIAFR